MNPRLTASVRKFIPAIAAGVALGASEAAVVGATRPELFLSIKEFARFTGIALSVAVSLQLIIASLLLMAARLFSRVSRARFELALVLGVGVIAAPLGAWLFWELTEGRRVRDWQYRPFAVCGAALIATAGLVMFSLALARLAQTRAPARRFSWGLLGLCSAGCLAADALVLHRLYPAFHIALSALALLFAAASASIWPFALPRGKRLWLVALLGLGSGVAAPFLLREIGRAPNLRYAVEQSAPLQSKLLRWLRVPPRAAGFPRSALPVHVASASAPQSAPTAPLRGQSILLITIDALRADRLRTYGSHQDLTPELDRFAEQSIVFDRAYTQTPHTSYALGSLFTGKYLRPVLSLPGAPHEHATLARILRRYGYRTAAFYPPAVFFVDEHRFTSLAADHFGFEYVKEMFAPASQRVDQLADYLRVVDKGHPLFVWVHLFEPHEPYEPPPEFARGSEPEQRYDGEVAAADASVGKLIRLFRAREPGSTVIVTADHGEEFGEHGGHHHGTTLFDEQVRVPLLWSSPGVTVPRRIFAPVQLVDIAPTLLSALGMPRDARMRGADLSSVLSGAAPSRTLRAFASIEELRMWCDGHYKLVCEASEGACRLYDLQNDPSESRDASAFEPGVAQRMGAELSELVASIPEVEALAMQSGDAWPKALARVRLGDASAGPELLPLLGDERPAVREETLRAIADLQLTAAEALVRTLANADAVPRVRDEASLCALVLGDATYVDRVRSVLSRARAAGAAGLDLARRAAFALMPYAPKDGAPVLIALAADGGATRVHRERALLALSVARVTSSVPQLIPLLEDVRLRPAVARALGQLGGALAEKALLRALGSERYPESRAAEVDGLLSAGDRRVKPLLLRFLGTEIGVPGGLENWARLPPPHTDSHGTLVDLRRAAIPSALRGSWECRGGQGPTVAAGCNPGAQAELIVPHRAQRGELRAVLSVWADTANEWLRLDEREFALRRGSNELAFFLRKAPKPLRFHVRASPHARIELVGVVPRSADIPPPAPKPWRASADAGAPR